MIGQNPSPLNWCTMKWATAIWPLQRKAAIPVMKPRMIRRPPTTSMKPANQMKENNSRCVPPMTPKTFCAPWQKKRKPDTIRRSA